MAKLIHGGDLESASLHYQIPINDWIDLSTGINPIAYPCENISQEAFTRLPYQSQAFKLSVKRYYGCHDYITVSGSQEVIQNLPSQLATLPIILPSLGYQEHHDAWTKAHSPISYYDSLNHASAIEEINTQLQLNPMQHLLIINPNNPSGLIIPKQTLLYWANIMKGDAKLIVDEAFIDLTPEESLLSTSPLPDKILVLRSCGKFFGLGGIRAGFLFGTRSTLSNLTLPYNPWSINGIALEILQRALANHKWQQESRADIWKNAELIESLFVPLGLKLISNQGLFLSYLGSTERLTVLYESFARTGILLRLIPVNSETSILRVGLLDRGNESAISRVKSCIKHASR